MRRLITLLPYGKSLGEVGVIRILGASAALLIQVIVARGLGVEDYGTFASIYAVLSISAFGTVAFQNSVAVSTSQNANKVTFTHNPGESRKIDFFIFQAIFLGICSFCLLLFIKPEENVDNGFFSIILVIEACVLFFSWIFARALGGLQGIGHVKTTVFLHSLASSLFRLFLIGVTLLFGGGLLEVLIADFLGGLPAIVIAYYLSRKNKVWGGEKLLDSKVSRVILLSICFAWLINIDVVLVQARTPPEISSQYAAAATLVKAGFIFPSILTTYLLPKFAKHYSNMKMVDLGFWASGVSAAFTGIFLLLFFLFTGNFITEELFGNSFGLTPQLLILESIAFLPWIVAQSLLIRMTIIATRWPLLLSIVTCFVFSLGVFTLLPDLQKALLFIFLVGVFMIAVFVIIHLREKTKLTS